MGGRDDELGLGLGLTLVCGGSNGGQGKQMKKQPALRMNDLSFPSSAQLMQTKRAPWADLFHLRPDGRLLGRGIDMNRLAAAEFEADEATRVSSPNSAVSSVLSGKRSEREPISDEAERASCSRGSDDEDCGDGGEDPSRKKLRLSKEQSLLLEQTFKEHNTLNPKQKLALAKQLNLRPRQVEVWFQNRRARTKLKQTEVDCEYLKRRCENLTEENRRLQKEVHELRALKRSPQLYMHMNPPTTLTMCPSCERVAVSSASASSSAARSGQGHPTKHQGAAAINPWAAMPIPHRPLNASGSRS